MGFYLKITLLFVFEGSR